MKQQTIFLILLTLALTAPTIQETSTTDFNQATVLTDVNTSNNQLQLTQSAGAYATSGTYNSRVYDLGSNPEGTISWQATSASGTTLLVRTRSGPTNNSSDSNWSAWSSAYTTSSGSDLQSPTNRYWQHSLELGTTNTANTPTVTSITLDYEETGPAIQELTNADLDSESTGDYTFNVQITDTLPLALTQARHYLGSNSTSYVALTPEGGDAYSYTVPEPSGGWSTRAGEVLRVEVQAVNNQSDTTTRSYNQTITEINYPPTINAVANQTATEGDEFILTVTASDPNDDNLTYTTTHGTISKVTNTQADMSWTPTRSAVGITNVTIMVSDAEYQDSTTFSVNTTGVNHPPEIQPINNFTGYYADNINWTITIDDLNENDNITITSTPSLNWQQPNNTDTTEYQATANFVTLDNYKGTTEFTIRVQDAEGATDETTATLTINYCGDNTCQEQEDANTCARDCAADSTPSYLAIEFLERICVNQTTTITVFNASSRYTCFYEGRTISSQAYCQPIRGIEVALFAQQGSNRQSAGTSTTNAEGTIEFTPSQPGRYRAVAQEEGFVSTEETFTANFCRNATNQEQVIEYERPDITATPRPTASPRPERPQVSPEELNLLAIFLFYVLAPLLAAALVYLSTEYYQGYKDTDPHLLELRIKLTEFHQAHTKPITDKITAAIAPYTLPAWNWTKKHLILPVTNKIRSLRRR